MPDRTAIVVSAVFASFFACVALTAVAGPAYAGDACITKPPQGSHWYYHVDPVTRRKCWHQRAEGLTVHQVGSSKPSLPAKTISKQGAETDRQQPTANSHTEQPIAEAQPSAPGLTGQSAPATSTDNAGAENPPQSLPSSGWPDQQSSADFHDRERELGRRAATDAGIDSQGRMPTAAAERPAQISTDRMLLALLVGALALSMATTGRLIFKYAAARGSTWKWTEPTFSTSDVSTRRADVVCDLALAKKNDGTPRIDRVTFDDNEKQGVEALLEQLHDELTGRRHAPQPARRQMIPRELSWTEELRQLLERYDGPMLEHRQPPLSRKMPAPRNPGVSHGSKR